MRNNQKLRGLLMAAFMIMALFMNSCRVVVRGEGHGGRGYHEGHERHEGRGERDHQ